MLSPDRISSSTAGVLISPSDAIELEVPTNGNEVEVVDIDSDDDDELTVSTAEDFLSELKEEVVLQSLLHKRIHEKDERVFQFEHKNGRRLLVVLPPDT
jgi:hypothetical protein